MLERILSSLVTMATVLLFAAGFVGFYQQTKFIYEWIEDHATPMGATTRWRLSTVALFSKSLSQRCRKRRQRLLFVVCTFVALMILQALMIFGLRSLASVAPDERSDIRDFYSVNSACRCVHAGYRTRFRACAHNRISLAISS
jgi:hypothetical protein